MQVHQCRVSLQSRLIRRRLKAVQRITIRMIRCGGCLQKGCLKSHQHRFVGQHANGIMVVGSHHRMSRSNHAEQRAHEQRKHQRNPAMAAQAPHQRGQHHTSAARRIKQRVERRRTRKCESGATPDEQRDCAPQTHPAVVHGSQRDAHIGRFGLVMPFFLQISR